MDEQYANSIRINMGFYDFTTTFIKETANDSDGDVKLHTEEVAVIRMSPQLMKLFSELLASNIKNYEDTFGVIPTPNTSGISTSKQE